MRRFLRVAVLTSLIVGGSAAHAHAQVVGAGFSFLHESGETGIGVSGDVRTKDLLSLGPHAGIAPVGDVSFHKFAGFSLITGQGGGRLTVHVAPKLIPYVQVTAGFEHCNVCAQTDAVIEPAFGVDIPVGGQPFNVRAAVGVRRLFIGGASLNETRFWIGASFGR